LPVAQDRLLQPEVVVTKLRGHLLGESVPFQLEAQLKLMRNLTLLVAVVVQAVMGYLDP
jgi:hypothetical protein